MKGKLLVAIVFEVSTSKYKAHMMNLNKTSLTTSQKIECAAKVIAMQEHSGKTQLSQEYNLSRPTLYELLSYLKAVLCYAICKLKRLF